MLHTIGIAATDLAVAPAEYDQPATDETIPLPSYLQTSGANEPLPIRCRSRRFWTRKTRSHRSPSNSICSQQAD